MKHTHRDQQKMLPCVVKMTAALGSASHRVGSPTEWLVRLVSEPQQSWDEAGITLRLDREGTSRKPALLLPK